MRAQIVGWFLVTLAGFAFLAAAVPPDVLYPLDIVVTTTSDWTDVRVLGATWVAEQHEILEGDDAPGLAVAAGAALTIGKASYDETRVSVRFRGYLAGLATDWLRLWIAKGHIGETTVSFSPRDGPDSSALVRFTHRGIAPGDDPDNARTFSLRASEITGSIEPKIVLAPSAESIGGQRVLAFYYPWYGSPVGPSGRWVHWEPARENYSSTHVPAAGYYDSLDPETVRRHIREAQAAGIDGFIASWWGVDTFEDRALRVLFEVAEEEGFLVTIYYEDAQSPWQVISDVSTILSRHGASPAFLSVDDVPVVFFYVRVVTKFSLTQWQSVLDALDALGQRIFAVADTLQPEGLSVFQGLHTYNPVAVPMDETAKQYASVSLAARIRGALFAATVLPGYREAVFRASSPRMDRNEGETYHEYWNIARASKPHWILVTSFNEWHEGSEIEPSIEFGASYLAQTAEEAGAWRAGAALPAEPVPSDRDGDGVPDEEDYCPDWPGDPLTNGC